VLLYGLHRDVEHQLTRGLGMQESTVAGREKKEKDCSRSRYEAYVVAVHISVLSPAEYPQPKLTTGLPESYSRQAWPFV
jgi:hypothetical protein